MTIRIGIVEDESLYSQQLIQLLDNWSKEQNCAVIHQLYTSEKELFQDDIFQFHLLFMDIKLGNDDGMNIARKLRKQGYNGAIIFATAYREYAFEGYEVHAYNYFIKPVSMDDVNSCLNEILQSMTEIYYLYCTKSKMIKIPYSQIYFFSSNKHYIDILTKEETYQQLINFKDIMSELPSCFIQCHRSTIVNIKKVVKIEKNLLFFPNDYTVPISKTYYAAVCNAYINYAKGKSSL